MVGKLADRYVLLENAAAPRFEPYIIRGNVLIKEKCFEVPKRTANSRFRGAFDTLALKHA